MSDDSGDSSDVEWTSEDVSGNEWDVGDMGLTCEGVRRDVGDLRVAWPTCPNAGTDGGDIRHAEMTHEKVIARRWPKMVSFTRQWAADNASSTRFWVPCDLEYGNVQECWFLMQSAPRPGSVEWVRAIAAVSGQSVANRIRRNDYGPMLCRRSPLWGVMRMDGFPECIGIPGNPLGEHLIAQGVPQVSDDLENFFPVCFDMRSLEEEPARIVIWLPSGTTAHDVETMLLKGRKRHVGLSYCCDGQPLTGKEPLVRQGTIQVQGWQG